METTKINETYSDSNPANIYLVELTDWTLTLSDLNWPGAAGIGVTLVTQDPNISLISDDAHSVQFHINNVSLYPNGQPYYYSETTIIQLTPIPEPTPEVFVMCGAVVAFGRFPKKHRARFGMSLGLVKNSFRGLPVPHTLAPASLRATLLFVRGLLNHRSFLDRRSGQAD